MAHAFVFSLSKWVDGVYNGKKGTALHMVWMSPLRAYLLKD